MNRSRTLFFCILILGFRLMAQLPDQTFLNTNDYEELLELFNEYDSDSLAQERIAYTYLNRARKENDTIKVARGYDRLARIYHPEKNIIYADSLIEYTKKWNHITYPAMGYILKAYEYGLKEDLKNTYKNYLKANVVAETNGNLVQQTYIMDRIIYLKVLWGSKLDALKLQHRRHKIVSSKPFLDELKNSSRPILERDSKTLLLQNLILSYESYIYCYLSLQQIDSANYYWNLHQNNLKTYENYDKVEKSTWGGDAKMEIQFFKKNYSKTIVIADSILSKINIEENLYNVKNCYLFKGLSKSKLGNDVEGMEYLLKADSIYDINNTLSDIESDRTLFQEIMNYYAKNRDYYGQIKYLDKMLFLDSLSIVNAGYLEPEFIRTYETPRLLKSKEAAIEALKRKNSNSRLFMFLIAIVLAITVILATYYYRQKVVFKKRFEALMKKSIKPAKTKKSNTELDISKEIVTEILNRLNKFEEKRGYLNASVTLNSLAKQFQTNSSYLSKVLNFHKRLNFAQYLNHLRVNYAYEKIEQDPNIRKFTIEAIACECGYKNAASFSRSFYQIIGIYPSFFIKELNKINT